MAAPAEFEGADWLEVRSRLGAGGFGAVYEAYDHRRKGVVAVKTLHEFEPEALYMLKQEFRAMADVAHPNVVTLYDLVLDGERCFFTMERIEGVDLLVHLRESRAADLRDAFVQLADGITALHEAGILHRDLKPSNVLVAADGRVVVLDFGLAAQLAFGELSHSVHMVGTIAYISPEQAAGAGVTEASDWYSFGVMLYEALTGRRPFSGGVLEMIEQKQSGALVPPGGVQRGIPADLNDLCCELLRPGPRDRPSGREVIRRLLLGPEGQGHAVEATPSGPSGPPVLVGREREERVLNRAFERVRSGHPVTVHLHGSSGIGKSAIARHFLRSLRQRDRSIVLLAGRCYEHESVPYKALDSLIDDLSRYLQHLPPLRAERVMPRDAVSLALLFPVLAGVEAIASRRERATEPPGAQELRRRAGKALRELLARTADERPLVLFIDDLHWGDQDSAALLEELVRPPDAPVLLLLLCYHSADSGDSPLVQRVRQWRGENVGEVVDVELGELGREAAQTLALSLIGEERSTGLERAEAIARESNGNPFFIGALARHAAAVGEGAVPQNSLNTLIRTSVGAVPEQARRMLEIVAVAGRPIDIGIAHAAAGLASEDEAVMGPLRAAHLVRARISEGGPQLETYHDRIRKAVVGTLSADELRAHHLQLARAWEQSGCADPQTLAQHWLEAGYGERAAAFAAEAAAQAAEALAFDRAARLYRLALELSTASGDERRILRTRLGDALSEAGRGSEAAEAYLSAVEGASIADGLELRRRASEQLLISGHIDRGLAVLRDVLGLMGMRLARTPERALAAQVVRRAQLRVRGLTYRERASDVLDADVLRHIDMCWSVTIGLSMVDTIRGTHFQSRHILAALRAGEPYRICRALAFEVSGSVVRGKRSVRRTEKLLQTGWALARRIDDPHALGLMAVANASAASFHGRFREALEMCERADTLLRDHCTGVVWELDTNEIFRLHSYCWMGRWKELSFRLPSLLREAREREDLYLATYLGSRSFYTVHLAADHVAEAREGQRSSIAAWSSQGFQVQHYWDWLACTEIDLYDERADVAWRRIEERWRAYLRSALHLNQALYIESLSLRARAALALAATHSDPNAHSDARKLLRTAARDAKRMSSQERPWGNALADLLRAGISATQGDAGTAATLAHAAEQQFNALDMGLHAAAARRRRGRLLGGAEGHSLAESAAAWMSEEGIKNPGRVTAMLIPGRWG